MRHRAWRCWMLSPEWTPPPVAAAFEAWNQVRHRIADLERDEHDRLRLLDLWSFQRKEIADARVQPEEDTKLEAEKRVLANSEKVFTAAMAAYDALYENNASAAASIRVATKHIEELSRFDEKFRQSLPELESARITLEDIGQTLRDYAEGIEASPARLAEVEDRLALLDRLKRKYGPTLDDVIALGDELERKLNEMENKDEVLRALEDRTGERRGEISGGGAQSFAPSLRSGAQAGEDGRERDQRAGHEGALQGRGQRLGRRRELERPGFDQVQYLISANPGEPLGPVEEIASGGELSRVMLALKTSVEAGQTNAADVTVGVPIIIAAHCGERVRFTADVGLR